MQDDYDYIARELGADNEAFEGAHVLLVGSQGFLGRLFRAYFNHLNQHVLKSPMWVTCIDIIGPTPDSDKAYPNENHFGDDISVDRGWFDPHLRWVVDKHGPIKYLLCLAGRASPRAYASDPIGTIDVTVQGTKHMLRIARDFGIKTYLGFSSSEIYGNPSVVPTPESYLGGVETYSERACYDISKLQLENLCYIYQTRFGVNTQIVRPFNILGYCANDGRVVPQSVAKLLKGDKLTVFEPGTQTRTFCWFSDFVVGTLKVLLHGDGKPYNIGNSENEVSMIDLARKLEALAGLKDMVTFAPPASMYVHEPMRRCPDITRARALGYEPRVTLDEALGRFWGWAKEEYTK